MNIVRFNPAWVPAPERSNWLRRFFDYDPFFTETDFETTPTFVPAVDIREEEDKYILDAELPGMKKEDVHIEVKDGVLTLSGERKFENEEKRDDYTRIERSYGSYQRTFTLPDHVDEEKIEAAYSEGVLTIVLPKGEEAKPKQIEVEVN